MENKKKFRSDSELIEYHIINFMEDEQPHDIPEIKAYVEKNTNKSFSEGKYSGVLYRLVQNNKCMRLGNGVYIKFYITVKPDIKKIADSIFSNAIEKVMKEIHNLNIINMSAKDFEKIQSVKETIELLKKRIDIGE